LSTFFRVKNKILGINRHNLKAAASLNMLILDFGELYLRKGLKKKEVVLLIHEQLTK
jgi:hypothetical protein